MAATSGKSKHYSKQRKEYEEFLKKQKEAQKTAQTNKDRAQ